MTRHRTLAGIAALVAIPVLAACTGGGGGGTAATPAPPAPSLPSAAAPSEPATPSAEPSTEPSAAAGPVDCPTTQPEPLAAGETRTVTIDTEQGAIEMQIEADLSPIAAGNFVALAACGWYDGVVFHRLVPGFVIQGGDGQYGRAPDVDPNLVGTGGPPYTIQDEEVTATYGRGTVAMARTPAPNSVGSQFFIVTDDEAEEALSSANTYQIIGTVTSGMEVVDAIAAMPNSGPPNNAALEPIPMTDVSVATP
jgi:cyclophilin family peptidyl-prolyl cis-trans isomerase